MTRFDLLQREAVATQQKHWVRLLTSCNNNCLFCLDAEAPRHLVRPQEELRAEIDYGIDTLGAERLVLSGGEASLHPAFIDLIAHAKNRGYSRVQTVTNGARYASRSFFERCIEAGLGEITFSLHGHTAALHDRLTRTEGAFVRLTKGMLRALREKRVIVNVSLVVNGQNVAQLDAIVEHCISLGVTEFDLLHIIPQGAAFENRELLFYDVMEHLPVLHKVFALSRHPRFHIWTNRFPTEALEGYEELIQDPHKLLDEFCGRGKEVQRYLTSGQPMPCRQKERCQHCFIEPLCTTVDRVISAFCNNSWQVLRLGHESWQENQLPFGCTEVDLEEQHPAQLADRTYPQGCAARVTLEEPETALESPLPIRPLTLVAPSVRHLRAYLTKALPPDVSVEVWLNRETAPWLLDNRDRLAAQLDEIQLHQPSHTLAREAIESDISDHRGFFQRLDLPCRVSGLPPCLAPGAMIVAEPLILESSLIDTETNTETNTATNTETETVLSIPGLVQFHIAYGYRVKSARCANCLVKDRCQGVAINLARTQGLAILTPLSANQAAQYAPFGAKSLPRLATGAPPQGPVSPVLLRSLLDLARRRKTNQPAHVKRVS